MARCKIKKPIDFKNQNYLLLELFQWKRVNLVLKKMNVGSKKLSNLIKFAKRTWHNCFGNTMGLVLHAISGDGYALWWWHLKSPILEIWEYLFLIPVQLIGFQYSLSSNIHTFDTFAKRKKIKQITYTLPCRNRRNWATGTPFILVVLTTPKTLPHWIIYFSLVTHRF